MTIAQSISAFISERLRIFGFVDLKYVRKEMRVYLFEPEEGRVGFLYRSLAQKESVSDEIKVDDDISVYLVRGLAFLPPPAFLKRRWWLCFYRPETEKWETVREKVAKALEAEGKLIWREHPLPWLIEENGEIRSFPRGVQCKIACARRQERILSEK